MSETNRGCSEQVKLGITTFILMIRIFRLLFIEFSQILQSFECTQHVSAATHIACSRRSNSRGREKNSQRTKKKRETKGGKGERREEGGRGKGVPLLSPSPLYQVYNLTRSPLTANWIDWYRNRHGGAGFHAIRSLQHRLQTFDYKSIFSKK